MKNVVIEIDGVRHRLVTTENIPHDCDKDCSLAEVCRKAHEQYGSNICDPFIGGVWTYWKRIN